MTDYLNSINTRVTPQTEPIPGTVENSAGGYSFAVDDWTRLHRFLILGSEGGSYYTTESNLTRENADALFRCIAEDGPRVVSLITEISEAGRNPKHQPILFALAACAGADDARTRAAALDALPRVARTGTHLFLFAGYVEQFRGWGRGLRTAVGKWYTERNPANLANQVSKYRQREGWSHRDLLRLAKPRPPRGSDADIILGWAANKYQGGNEYLDAVNEITTANEARALELIATYNLPWEVVPTPLLAEPSVWRALIGGNMPVGAMVRNLARMTANGAIKPFDASAVVATLTSPEAVKASRIHPLNVLNGALTYGKGRGLKGSLSWEPITEVVDALDTTFELAFDNVEPANKRTLVALDVSGSMGWSFISGTAMSAREAAAAIALVTVKTEPQVQIMAFADKFMPLPIGKKTSYKDALSLTSGLPFGGTDCSIPMAYALANNLAVDTFVVITDSETWAGRIHPVQALRQYRQTTGIPARLIVVGMVSNRFSIADPDDAGMLDVVGFDSAAPALIADFSAGRV